MERAERRRLRIDPDRFADWNRLVAIARGQARAADWWEKREAMEVRVLLAMLEAGLTAREIDVYWLRVGCQWGIREIGRQLRMPNPMTAWRLWTTSEDKLRAWVRREGLKSSPLWRSAPVVPKSPRRDVTARAYG